MSESEAATTRFCARIIGPLMLIVGAVVIARFDDIALMLPNLFQDTALLFVTGLFTLIAGLVLLAAHHHWNSAVAIAISLLGVLTVLRGVVLLTMPTLLSAVAASAMHAMPGALAVGALAMLIGMWLTHAGWLTRGKI